MADKELVILIDYDDLKSVDLGILERCDRVAMTPLDMLAFEQADLSYMTFEDFYDYKDFRVDNSRLTYACERLFSDLDNKYSPFLEFPRVFSASIYFFLVFFADLYYISSVFERVLKKYEKIYIFSRLDDCKDPIRGRLIFSSERRASFNIDFGLRHKVAVLHDYLGEKCVRFEDKNTRRRGANDKRLSLMSSKMWIKNILLKLKARIDSCMLYGKKTVFVIQDGYEVSLLKKFIPEFRFENPAYRLLKTENRGLKKRDIPILFKEELEKFSNEWFPKMKPYIYRVFEDYHENIICGLDAFGEYFETELDRHDPACLLYSMGADNVCEELCAYLSSKRGIPVFYFQHGVTHAFWNHPWVKYIDRNIHVKKTAIVHSKTEKAFWAREDYDCQALGSIKSYDFYKRRQRRKTKLKKALYVSGPFSFNNYKSLMVTASDMDMFETNKDVISAAVRFNLSMDIKVHPADENYNYGYFDKLTRHLQGADIRVIRNIPAEHILENYELIIVDYFHTAVLSNLILLDTPAIIYQKDTDCLKEEAAPDIESRFYMARGKSNLEAYLSVYKEGKLGSKFLPYMIDKYVFPLNGQDPGESISRYIRERVSS